MFLELLEQDQESSCELQGGIAHPQDYSTLSEPRCNRFPAEQLFAGIETVADREIDEGSSLWGSSLEPDDVGERNRKLSPGDWLCEFNANG